jgi:uncharacterized membrane protein YfcA
MILWLLLVPLGLFSVVHVVLLIRTAIERRSLVPSGEATGLGAVANFFDTLGVGSIAPTMAWFKFRGLVPDQLIPATTLAGYTLPTAAQSAIFLVLLGVRVDPVLLVGSIAAVTIGAAFGVSLVARTPIRIVRGGVGVALLLAALIYTMGNLKLMPIGGHATALALPWLITAIAAQVVIGVLLNFGVGNYAPTLIMLSLMGMDPRLAFPIMASAGAFALVSAGTRYVRAPNVDLGLVIGMAMGGVVGVLIAAFVVKNMSVELLRWLVVAVVLYAAARMLYSALRPVAESAG